jgi:hypothetical protein
LDGGRTIALPAGQLVVGFPAGHFVLGDADAPSADSSKIWTSIKEGPNIMARLSAVAKAYRKALAQGEAILRTKGEDYLVASDYVNQAISLASTPARKAIAYQKLARCYLHIAAADSARALAALKLARGCQISSAKASRICEKVAELEKLKEILQQLLRTF